MVQQVNWGNPGKSLWWQQYNQAQQPGQGAGQPYQYAAQQGLQTAQQAPPEQSMTTGGQPATPNPSPGNGWWYTQTGPVPAQQAQYQGGPNWTLQTQQSYPQAGMEYSGPGDMYYSKAAQETPTVPPGTKPLFNPETVQKGNEAIYGPTAAAQGDGKVKVNADGSWTLPNGSTIPGAARTVVDIDGVQIPLPFFNGSDMQGRGDFRFTVNGHQINALGFLVQRLKDARGRGLNIQDPNVIYDEIARIRDDMKAAGVSDADLDRASGIGGLQNFIRTAGSAAAAGNGAPPGTTPQAGGGQGGGQTGTPPTVVDPTNRGRISDEQVRLAMQDTSGEAAMALWRLYKYGRAGAGNGVFSDQLDQMMKPYVISGMQALKQEGMPTGDEVRQWFAQLDANASQTHGELGRQGADLARQRLQGYAGKPGQSWQEVQDEIQAIDPLFVSNLNPLNQQSYLRQRRDDFANLYGRQLVDPSKYYQYGNWWQDLQALPWWQQYYR